MRFTCKVQENASNTRAASNMQKDFMVSAYKAFGTDKRQNVMDRYHIKYSPTGTNWDGNQTDNWEYVGVDSQIERYWDYNSFPYRFNAIAPYVDGDKSKHTLTDKQVTINASYKMQTWIDGVKTPATDLEAEPYWLAQVQRATSGKDTDVMAGKEISNASGDSQNRYVALPFHHLNSKIRFALYSTSPWASAHPMYIKALSIKVVSSGFVTGAGQYTVTGDTWYVGTGTSGFTSLQKASEPGTELLHFSGIKSDGTPLEDNDLSKWQTPATAFWFDSKAKDGLMQIPQDNVKMTVSMDLMLIDGDDVLVFPFRDIPVKLALEGQTPTDSHHWQSGNIYTYYLVIDNVGEKLAINFTATLTPWEDLSGSLTTDLEK